MTAGRRCLDCPRIGAWKRGRCPDHARTQDYARGTPTQRGYGPAHQAESRRWKARVAAGELVICWRCDEPITDPDDCDLGHDDVDRTITRGPEHARRCNRAAAGRASHAYMRRDA